ncbi:MAG TPA: M3 family metallopeptidase [Xanthomonadaceae bacterium]|nr:M3 family metallopeptidase [Xanthomonadaceae bacterium]
MRTPHFFALVSALALGACTTVPTSPDTAPPVEAAAEAVTVNPLLVESTLPYRYPHFDRIRDEHFVPAFEQGMSWNRAEIDAIASNPEPPTFENTIAAMERTGDALGRANRIFSNLNATDTNPTRQQIQKDLAPKLAAHQDAIYLDGTLFARIDGLHGRRATLGLDSESLRLLERYHTRFVRAGARLSEADKDKLRTLNSELASLATEFSQKVLAGTNASAVAVDTAAELDGLSPEAVSAAAEAARSRGLDGKYVIALQNTSGQPPLSSLTNRALRERIWRASVQRGTHGDEHDTRATVARTATLRAERAALLGHRDHASWVLEDQTARTTQTVNEMLERLAPAAVANARREAADMQKIIDAEGGDFQLQPWDWAFYAEKLRQQRYDFDETRLKPYFELERVLHDGVFFAANQLYGLSFSERHDLPVYHPDVRVYEVFNADGSPLGLFLTDLYARESKRGGAWMNSYVLQSGLYGTRPVVANHLNIPKPPEGQPTLMTYDEANTLFHEFGHALHGLFSNVQWPLLAATQVPRDFVEYPSQVNEMWMTWPEILRNYAVHHETGEPMPRELVDKIEASKKFNQGFATTEYLAASLLDQAWHQLPAGQVPDEVEAFEARALAGAGVAVPEIPPRYRSTYFSHVFSGGYSAGYYSYIWSEVLDADTVAWFEESGGLKRELGDRFRDVLLSRGGSIDAMEMFRTLRGRDPDITPLLERRGLVGVE